MSADTTEQDGAGGNDMRARYLPVSRRELRRRREEELAQQRAAQEEAEATSDELAQAPQAEATPESEDELSRAVEDTEAAEAVDLPAPPQREESGDDVAEPDTPDAEEPGADAAETEDSEDQVPAEVPEDELPEPADEEGPARPEEEIADAEAQETEATDDDAAADDSRAVEADVALSPEEVAALTAGHEENAAEDEPKAEGTEGEPEEPDDGVDVPEADAEAEVPELIDYQDAPVPASRKAKRLLRETESLPKLAPELMDELNETTGEIAKHDDPERVDPELLKKQQALAAKAMQANQSRMRQQQADSERDAQRRGDQQPESEVITGKTVRDARDGHYEEDVFLTGHIDPIDAQGAHGLELNEMLDESSKQAGRQNMMMWLLIVLAVLLLVAIGIVIFTVIL